MRSILHSKVITLNHTGETFTNTGACHINHLAITEDIYTDFTTSSNLFTFTIVQTKFP